MSLGHITYFKGCVNSLPVCVSVLCLPLFLSHFLIPENGRASSSGTLIYVAGIQEQWWRPGLLKLAAPPVLATPPQPLSHPFLTFYAEGITLSPCGDLCVVELWMMRVEAVLVHSLCMCVLMYVFLYVHLSPCLCVYVLYIYNKCFSFSVSSHWPFSVLFRWTLFPWKICMHLLLRLCASKENQPHSSWTYRYSHSSQPWRQPHMVTGSAFFLAFSCCSWHLIGSARQACFLKATDGRPPSAAPRWVSLPTLTTASQDPRLFQGLTWSSQFEEKHLSSSLASEKQCLPWSKLTCHIPVCTAGWRQAALPVSSPST